MANRIQKVTDADLSSYGIDESQVEGMEVGCYEAQRLLDQTDPEASGCDETHLWLESMEAEEQYEIGGQCVRMTAQQAAAWNAGNVTEETLRGATIFLPSRTSGRSYVRDGEVIVDDGLPTGESVSLWSMCEDEKFYGEYLEGNPARPIA